MYDTFKAEFAEAQKKYGDDVRILKGIFGRNAQDLMDFGIAPEKSERKKKEAAG